MKPRTLPTDIVLAAYLLSVGALQLLFYRPEYTSLVRAVGYVLGGVLVLALAWVVPMPRRSWLVFLRTAYPLMLTAVFFVQLNQLFFTVVQHYVDPWFVRLERLVFGVEPAHWLPAMFPARWMVELMAFFYTAYYLAIPVLAALLFFCRREAFYRAVWGLTLGFYACYFIYVVLPVAGPTILNGISLEDQFHGYAIAGLLKHILAGGEVQAACFPSSHVAITFLVALYAARYQTRWAWFFTILSLGVGLATVWLKQHYAIDVISGYAVGVVFFLVAEKLAGRFEDPFEAQ